MYQIDTATLTDPGNRRSNEDALYVGQADPVWFAILADGAGGHRGGALASSQVVNDLRLDLEDLLARSGGSTCLQPQTLTDLVVRAHRHLQQIQHPSTGLERMHTTVTVLWLDAYHHVVLWSHVGDSRLYRLRYGAIDHVSSDDSVVSQMVRAGLITPEQAARHPARHQLFSALGVEDEIEPHTLPHLSELEDGDAFLLCSDGWWEPLGDQRITQLCREAHSPRDWLERMQAEIKACRLPQQDNYSAVAIWVEDPTEITRSPGDPDDTVLAPTASL